jgi:triosephosphate isomerase
MQIKTIFCGVDAKDVKKVAVAYEPIWAIGAGAAATAQQAEEVSRAIRDCIREIYGARYARSVTILYGGSMNPKNAGELLAMPDVDGGLIGGASLDCDSFVEIIEQANQ